MKIPFRFLRLVPTTPAAFKNSQLQMLWKVRGDSLRYRMTRGGEGAAFSGSSFHINVVDNNVAFQMFSKVGKLKTQVVGNDKTNQYYSRLTKAVTELSLHTWLGLDLNSDFRSLPPPPPTPLHCPVIIHRMFSPLG